VGVEIKNEQWDGLIPQVKSPQVSRGERMEITFQLESKQLERPFMAWSLCKLIATSLVNPILKARLKVCAYVRCSPLCAVIESSTSFYVNGSSCALAPRDYCTSLTLNHRLPDRCYSTKSLIASVSPLPNNETSKPVVIADPERQTLDLRFQTAITGRCAGILTVALGAHGLYKLPLNVFVNRHFGVEIRHPAAPQCRSLSLSSCKGCFIIITNRGSARCQIKLQSTCDADAFDKSSFPLDGFRSAVVRVSFGDSESRIISCDDAHLEIRRVSIKPRFESDNIVVDGGAFIHCYLIHRNKEPQICYLTRTMPFPNGQLPDIVTEIDHLVAPQRSSVQTESQLCLQFGLDPAQNPASEHHLVILISDFLSPQVLDRKQNWSQYLGRSNCIFLALRTEWNREILNQRKIPPDVYEHGLRPTFNENDRFIRHFEIDPMEICRGIPTEPSILSDVVGEIVNLIVNKTEPLKGLSNVTVKIVHPVSDHIPIWAQLEETHEKSNAKANDVFFQIQSLQKFPLVLLPVDDGKTGIIVQVSERLETAREWLDRKDSSTGPSSFDGIAKDITVPLSVHNGSSESMMEFGAIGRGATILAKPLSR
jgi:hypothetical protein